MDARALQHLDMFMRTVERDRGDGISEEAADELITQVQPIVDAEEMDPLLPIVTCVEELADGWIGHFGFINPNDSMEIAPVGALNQFDPVLEDRGQPTSFEPGAHEDLFTVAYEGEALTWHLDGNEAAATVESPRCEAPPPEPVTTVTTINYTYDPLYRLVEANYDSSEFFHYAYDAVGNRQTQTTHQATNAYTYDAANRLTNVDGVPYSWDSKGNLLEDGTRTYTYNHANRLTSVEMGVDSYTYAYSGLGDRLQQTINGNLENYTLDLASVASQVLFDERIVYLYGVGRSGQEHYSDWQYHYDDALDSVRQIGTNSSIIYTQSFKPYGEQLALAGLNPSSFGFSGEWTDASNLIHLRARYYQPNSGRFFQLDPWDGSLSQPSTFNPYLYVGNNPINYTDPTGQCYGPLEFLRKIPVEKGICTALDQALFIYAWPGSSNGHRTAAAAYIGGWAFAHSALVVGVAGLAIAGGQAAISWIYSQYLISSRSPLIPRACRGVVTAWQTIKQFVQKGSSVWRLPNFQRGQIIEQFLGHNLTRNFPVIDRWINGTATSIKSINLSAPTYQSLPRLAYTIRTYASTLSNWGGSTWGGVTIRANMIATRELLIAIPIGATEAQLQLLQQLQVWAMNHQNPIIISIVTIP